MASTRKSSFIWLLVFYTVLEWLVIIGATYCTFRAFPVTSELGFTDAIITLGFMAFGSIVQIPAVGGGMQIATVLILTEFYGLSLEAATGIALVIWINTFVIIVPIGLALAFNEGIKWRSLKTLGASSSDYSL
jgi:glycosyltransferase 2 family protein